MDRYFGTDGIRGVVPKELTYEIALMLGNALTTLKEKAKVVVGADTRRSGDFLVSALSCGVTLGGGSVYNLGVATTPKVSYITNNKKFDFGVVVSASHNEAKYNGLKVFDSSGQKIMELDKEKIEDYIFRGHLKEVDYKNIGKIVDISVDSTYEQFVISFGSRLKGLKIVLDNSNGSASGISQKLFKKLDAKVISIASRPNGININDKCGATYIQTLQKSVIKNKADMGFAFDGDADRIIAVDENGKVVDGDMILYVLARHYKSEDRLNLNTVVGTKQSNLGFEKALNDVKINLMRSDVGDSYVVELMNKYDCVLGGENSGHIIMGDKLMTGDGVLTAITLASILSNSGKSLSELVEYEPFP
ncbi:MAG: phosphoglucosamine mutase, partial [Clostridia bacterium]